SEPTSISPLYGPGPVHLDMSTTVKARAYRSDQRASNVGSRDYELRLAAPTFTPAGGNYRSAQQVAILETSPGATVRDTTDGTSPGTASPIYSGPITVSTRTTVKAIAFRTGWTDSAISGATYTFSYGTAAAPQMAPLGGSYTDGVTVALSSATPGSTIR